VLSNAASVEGAGEEDGKKVKRKRGKSANEAGKVRMRGLLARLVVAALVLQAAKRLVSLRRPPFHQQTPVFDCTPQGAMETGVKGMEMLFLVATWTPAWTAWTPG
jgi:hypothetical protein